MSVAQMNIDLDYFDKEVDFSNLREATNRLCSASENQFAQIKNEKWYTRLFDAVTFSKKKDKRLAANITSLAQAQQVLIELLIRLSSRDTKVAALVEESFDKIAELSASSLKIAEAVKILRDRCILGLEKSSDIGDLTGTSKQILAGVLLLVAERFNNLSEAQQKYNDSVLRYIKVIDPQHIDLSKTLREVTDSTVKRKILVCAMELAFLHDLTFDFEGNFSDFIDEFDFGSRTIREIKDGIQKAYKLRGVDGFYNKYGHMDYEVADTFMLEIELGEEEVEEEESINKRGVSYDELFNEERKARMAQRTDMVLDGFVVKAGEEVLISDKNLTVKTMVLIQKGGKLIIENSRIDTTPMGTNYGKRADGVWDNFESFIINNSTLVMKDCEFIKKTEPDEFYQKALEGTLSREERRPNYGYSIKIEGKSEIHAENCYFEKIYKFCGDDANEGTPDSFVFRRCLFDSCYDTFITSFKTLTLEQSTVHNHINDFLRFVDYPVFVRCVFENSDIKNTGVTLRDSDGISIIKECDFRNGGGLNDFAGSIFNSTFERVGHGFGERYGKISGQCAVSFKEVRSPISTNKLLNFIVGTALTISYARHIGIKESVSLQFSSNEQSNEEYNASLQRGDCQVIGCTFIDIPEIAVANADRISDCIFTSTTELSVKGMDRPADGGDVGSGAKGYLFLSLGEKPTIVSNCSFTNVAFQTKKSYGDSNGYYFYLIGYPSFSKKSYKMAQLINCAFENCSVKGEATKLVPERGQSNEAFTAKVLQVLKVENCKFSNCSPER